MAEKTNFSSDSNTANFATFNDATSTGEAAATKPTSLNLEEVSKPSSNEAQRPQHLLPPPYPLISSPRDFSPHELPFFLNNNFNNPVLPENIEQQLKKLNLGSVSEEMKQFKGNTDINNLFYNKVEPSYSNSFNNNLPSDFENDILTKFSQQRFNNIPEFNPYEQPSTHTNLYNNNNMPENIFSKLRQQFPLNDYNINNMKHTQKQMPFGLSQDAVTKFYLSELLKNAGSTYNNINNTHMECYSRKVFVGGLPPDSDENEITASFRQFGPLIIDWPHKAESKTTFPPKGYCFLLFQDEMSVQRLMESCMEEDGKYFWCVSSAGAKDKPARRVQIRPWCLVDSDFLMDASQPLDLRKTIFVGGVPRPLRAVELALSMDQLYGGVCYAGIDTDPELKYPKGAGRVSFSRQQSYISAISARFVQLQFGDIDKRVEVKPYVLDDQLCDECQGQKSSGKSAPYFCANVACLQYYCEVCWVQIHSRAGRESHKPLVKEGADRPKSIPPFKW